MNDVLDLPVGVVSDVAKTKDRACDTSSGCDPAMGTSSLISDAATRAPSTPIVNSSAACSRGGEGGHNLSDLCMGDNADNANSANSCAKEDNLWYQITIN